MPGDLDPVERVRDEKLSLRRRLRSRRDRMRASERDGTATALRDVLLDVPEVGRAAVVALYIGTGVEPGTGPLLDALTRRGIEVLVPVMLRDGDLDWARFTEPLVPNRFGIPEPTGPRLGVDAIGGADAVLAPGLAVDRNGTRLGRGGGSYDRALARIAPAAFSCVLLYDGEVSDQTLPRAPHDHPVLAAATPSGLVRFT